MIDWNQVIRDLFQWLVPTGAVITIAVLILNHAPALRNRITREFSIAVERTGINIREGEVVSVDVSIVITATHREPIKILDRYLKYSDDVPGVSKHGIPINGRYDLPFWNQEAKGVFTHCRYIPFTFRRNNGFIQKFSEGQVPDFKVIVVTNKYGVIASPIYSTSSLLNIA